MFLAIRGVAAICVVDYCVAGATTSAVLEVSQFVGPEAAVVTMT